MKSFSKIQLLEFANHLHQHRTNMLCVFSEKERMAMRLSSFLNQVRVRSFIETTLTNNDASLQLLPTTSSVSLSNLPMEPPTFRNDGTYIPVPIIEAPIIPKVPGRRGRPPNPLKHVNAEGKPKTPTPQNLEGKIQLKRSHPPKEYKDDNILNHESSHTKNLFFDSQDEEEWMDDDDEVETPKRKKINLANKGGKVKKKYSPKSTFHKKKGKEESKKRSKTGKKKSKNGMDDFLVAGNEEGSRSYDSQESEKEKEYEVDDGY